ncbi:MAG: 6-phosphogluconolactonase [Nitrospirales bacterium]|nr:6-phosphogluconolactonase [Nitrospira sp.]MDR4501413.1 6-phosphogluconolactonase [Nitrospirales bacterium]
MRRLVHKVSSPQQLFPIAAQTFSDITKEAIARSGRMIVALAGGSTPRALYELMANEPYRLMIDWKNLFIFWGDERHVPPDHQDSNYRMAHDSLLSKVPVVPDRVHRMHGELEDAGEAAERYEQVLREVCSGSEKEVPRFDLILLGMGPDGHTASLFPGTEAVHESSRWVVAPWVEKFQTSRVTMTPVVLNHARHILFLVSGKDKAPALEAVLEGPSLPDEYPSQVIAPKSGGVTWLVDENAASLLKTTVFHAYEPVDYRDE